MPECRFNKYNATSEKDHLGVGEPDGVLEVIILTIGELVVPEVGKPALLDAAAKPCRGTQPLGRQWYSTSSLSLTCFPSKRHAHVLGACNSAESFHVTITAHKSMLIAIRSKLGRSEVQRDVYPGRKAAVYGRSKCAHMCRGYRGSRGCSSTRRCRMWCRL
jgi:hypothetical protein